MCKLLKVAKSFRLVHLSPDACGRRQLYSLTSLPLTLLGVGTRLAFLSLNGVEHDLVRIALLVALVSLAPVIAYSVGEDVAARVESGCCDAASNTGVTL